jgi:putative two-component system response regulator
MKRRILIIDDDPNNIRYLTRLLRSSYDISFAKSGIKGLELLNTDIEVHAILLDIMMPEMDGFAVLKKIQEQSALQNIPVLLCTGDSGIGTIEQGIDAGAYDFLFKPFCPKLIKKRIDNIFTPLPAPLPQPGE